MQTRTTRPLVPEDRTHLRPRDTLVRAAVVAALQKRRGVDVTPSEVYPEDRVTPIVLKAAADPAMLATSDWAGTLAQQSVADFIVGLAQQSAAAALIARGLKVSLIGSASIRVPTALLTAADAGGFVNEGDPLTVRNLNISGPTLWPTKFGTIVAFTDDLIAQAVQDFEAVVRQLLTEACALALDAAMFSADARSTSRPGPAGIISGVSPIAATSGGGAAALAKDVENLVAALAAVGGGKDVVFVLSPHKSAALKIWAGPKFDYPILASSAVDAATIIAVDAGLFVSAFGAVPEFRTSNEAVAHFEDASPQQISTDGTVAAPVRSLWQTRCTAVRLILRTAWALRVDGGAQYIDSVTW